MFRTVQVTTRGLDGRAGRTRVGLDGTGRGPGLRQKTSEAHQRLSGQHLQEGDEVVSISEVLVQVGDVSLRLDTKDRKPSLNLQPCLLNHCC